MVKKIYFFGFDFFNKESITNALVLDIPLQADYEISFAEGIISTTDWR